jgi:uncharacterized membrane protein YedE/YeeE
MLANYTIPLLGGFLIGGSAVMMLLFLGRIAGISGILWAAVTGQADNSWRWLFILGLFAGPLLYHQLLQAPYPAGNVAPWWQAIVGGLLVGVGVKMGSGCTSGHGVCGLGRLSPRSLIATIVFMSAGIVTVYFSRHLLGGL